MPIAVLPFNIPIISDIEKMGGEEVYLEVRVSNTDAIAFYKKLEFKKRGIIKGFYGDEDAVVMAKKI